MWLLLYIRGSLKQGFRDPLKVFGLLLWVLLNGVGAVMALIVQKYRALYMAGLGLIFNGTIWLFLQVGDPLFGCPCCNSPTFGGLY